MDARYPGFGHFVGISFNGCKHAEVEEGFPTSPNFLKVKREPSTSAGLKRLVRTAALLVRAAGLLSDAPQEGRLVQLPEWVCNIRRFSLGLEIRNKELV